MVASRAMPDEDRPELPQFKQVQGDGRRGGSAWASVLAELRRGRFQLLSVDCESGAGHPFMMDAVVTCGLDGLRAAFLSAPLLRADGSFPEELLQKSGVFITTISALAIAAGQEPAAVFHAMAERDRTVICNVPCRWVSRRTDRIVIIDKLASALAPAGNHASDSVVVYTNPGKAIKTGPGNGIFIIPADPGMPDPARMSYEWKIKDHAKIKLAPAGSGDAGGPASPYSAIRPHQSRMRRRS